MNQVKRMFAPVTSGKSSVAQLEADFRAFISAHNADPKLFGLAKSADDILASIARCRLRLHDTFIP